MTEYFVEKFYDEYALKKEDTIIAVLDSGTNAKKVCDLLNEKEEQIKELEKDVEYWKQVASQYSNELNVFEHIKRYKTECKDIYWSSD